MAVLIEGLTLVVRQLSLDVGFEGGTNAFAEALLELENPPRFICTGDSEFVNASFYDPDHVRPAERLLVASGLINVDEESNSCWDFAYVDQESGPTMPCPWLEWKRMSQGFTMAWESSKEPGDLAAPAGWTPAQSRGMTRTDIRNDPDRMMHMATEDGFETWLDLGTGMQVKGVATPIPEPAPSASLQDLLDTALNALDWKAMEFDSSIRCVSLQGEQGSYDCSFVALEGLHVIACTVHAPMVIPESARIAAMEYVTRANYLLPIGAFELSLESGQLGFRTAVDLEQGTATPTMIANVAYVGVAAMDRYHAKLLEVVYGARSPRDAVAEAEE